MKRRGLVERLAAADAAMPSAPVVVAPAHLLDDIARRLRETIDNTARKRAEDDAEGRQAAAVVDIADVTGSDELPTILLHPLRTSVAASVKREPRRGQVMAPTILASALVVVALLMSASIADYSRVRGLGWLSDKPRPKLAARALPSTETLTASLDAGIGTSSGVTASEPLQLSLSEMGLLERCETMIASGDMQGARLELAHAASAGSPVARFALAETFDPNMLAAWGLRDRVADVGTARALYAQALESGVARAAQRISALEAERP